MSEQWELTDLMQPLSSDAPCGVSLEDSQLLASFDAFRLFGRSVPFDPAPNWREIEAKSQQALGQSKDFRLLAHLSAATLRTKGVLVFLATLGVAARWLSDYWSNVFPQASEDTILRKNALNSFADRIAVIDGLRRHPLIRHPQLGTVSLRQIEIAKGLMPVAEGEEKGDPAHIHAIFAASDLEELGRLCVAVTEALDALKAIETTMRDKGGAQAVPTFDPLLNQLGRLQSVLREELSTHPNASDVITAVEVSAPNVGDQGGGSRTVGAIGSRQDAIRALEAVAAYFRQTEPSSPIPLFIDRAKRLVGKDFLDVLNEIAPEGLAQARNAGGLRDD